MTSPADSEGSIHITSADPDAPLDIDPNYLATEHDRTTSVDPARTALLGVSAHSAA
ncbi:GMC oxidoreductase [Kribbella capetownensis]|uniref:GMC oxidoreductase n=1 Tax=Kribbella capetownensis TaxID=1572659 RepID=UPI00192D9CF3|nr:GMC oxidoreductase [Kribbella capetownensis]